MIDNLKNGVIDNMIDGVIRRGNNVRGDITDDLIDNVIDWVIM